MSCNVPLKRVAKLISGQSPKSDDISTFNGQFPFLQGNAEFGATNPNPRFSCDVAPKRCRQGDLLVSVRAPVGALNIADREYGIGRGLSAIRPTAINSKYLWWCLHGLIEQLRSRSVGSTYDAVTVDDVGAISIWAPSQRVQSDIARFLDVETTRIDCLIAKKRSLVELLEERKAGLVEQRIRELVKRFGERRLKLVTSEITVGIVITPSEWYADTGVPALRGLNVRPGRIERSAMVFLSEEGHRVHPKSTLHAGDVVVVRTGQAGAAAVVPDDLDGANCIDLLIIRPRGIDSKYLVHVLNSDWTQKHIAKHSVGTIQAHFNVSALAELPLPVPDMSIQESVVREIDAVVSRLDATKAKLEVQIDLLREHRQALITAAVAGELEVPGGLDEAG